MLSLNQLLDEALTQDKERKLKEKLAKKPSLSLVQEFHLESQWVDEANVLTFDRYTCTCGCTSDIFTGLTVKQVPKTNRDGSARYLQVEEINPGLANKRKIVNYIETSFCGECCSEAEWPEE